MRKLALGIAAAAALLAVSAPAMAQVGFYAGPGGVEVGVAPPVYGPYGGYYDYYGGPGVVVGPGWHHHYWHHWR
jgi:hypothetical protein